MDVGCALAHWRLCRITNLYWRSISSVHLKICWEPWGEGRGRPLLKELASKPNFYWTQHVWSQPCTHQGQLNSNIWKTTVKAVTCGIHKKLLQQGTAIGTSITRALSFLQESKGFLWIITFIHLHRNTTSSLSSSYSRISWLIYIPLAYAKQQRNVHLYCIQVQEDLCYFLSLGKDNKYWVFKLAVF